jgi:hypothetical protein
MTAAALEGKSVYRQAQPSVGRKTVSRVTVYLFLKDRTGLASAALILWELTVRKAISKASKPATASTRYKAKAPASHFRF